MSLLTLELWPQQGPRVPLQPPLPCTSSSLFQGMCITPGAQQGSAHPRGSPRSVEEVEAVLGHRTSWAGRTPKGQQSPAPGCGHGLPPLPPARAVSPSPPVAGARTAGVTFSSASFFTLLHNISSPTSMKCIFPF